VCVFVCECLCVRERARARERTSTERQSEQSYIAARVDVESGHQRDGPAHQRHGHHLSNPLYLHPNVLPPSPPPPPPPPPPRGHLKRVLTLEQALHLEEEFDGDVRGRMNPREKENLS